MSMQFQIQRSARNVKQGFGRVGPLSVIQKVISVIRFFEGVPASSLPRHHPLQPRPRIVPARPPTKDRDAKTTPAIASLTPQPKLQIKDERIRRQPMPPLQKARKNTQHCARRDTAAYG